MNEYVINQNTLVILGKETYSKVIENNEEILINKLPTDIIKASCFYYGSSFKGRLEGTKAMIGVTYKCPIIISETKEIIMFPTNSFRDSTCCWIALNNVLNYFRNKEEITIIFKNNVIINLNLTIGVFDKQILRATRLLSVLNGRKS